MEILDVISKCEISRRFRLVLFGSVLALVGFHLFVLSAPLVCPTVDSLDHYRKISDSLTNVSVALILLLIVVQLQADLHANYRLRRQRSYEKITAEIVDWFKAVRSPLFDRTVVASEPASAHDALQNFTVRGSAERIRAAHGLEAGQAEQIATYCDKVHFELTNYPSEMIYGVHFELDDRSLNEALCSRFLEHHGFADQIGAFAVDREIPKRPEWVFLTRTVTFDGDTEASFARNLTHARHFVELVGHAYEVLYGRDMTSFYLDRTGQKKEQEAIAS